MREGTARMPRADRCRSAALAGLVLVPSACLPAPADDARGDAGIGDVAAVDASTGDARVGGAPPEVVAPFCAFEDGRPVPVLPRTGEVLRTLRPRFRWRTPGATSLVRVRVEVCADRGCATVVASAVVEANAWQPTDPLAAGVRFWRVIALPTDGNGERVSATRTLVVPAQERGPHGFLWRDFDGDGLEDTVTYERAEPRAIRVRYANPAVPDTVLWQPASQSAPRMDGCSNVRPESRHGVIDFGLGPVGDVDGDGYPDALVSQRSVTALCARPWTAESVSVLLALGGPAGLRTPLQDISGYTVKGGALSREDLPSAYGTPDLDGDGYDDLIVSPHFNSVPMCQPFSSGSVLHGGPGRCGGDATGIPGAVYGVRVVPDLDGDGLEEVCAEDTGLLHCYAVRGRRAVEWRPPPTCQGVVLNYRLPCTTDYYLPDRPSVHATSDANGDGLSDLMSEVATVHGRGRVTFFGGDDGLSADRCRL